VAQGRLWSRLVSATGGGRESGQSAPTGRLAGILAVLVLALVLAGVATPAWGCQSSNHCYGAAFYGANKQGVRSNVEIVDHQIASGFTANFILASWDANNWMTAGYIVGNSVIGNTAVPRGYSDWKNGGAYDHTGFVCQPDFGSFKDTRVVNRDAGWKAIVCSNELSNSPDLGTDHAVPYGETELTHNANGCREDYQELQYLHSGDWDLWPSITKFRDPDDSSNPIVVSLKNTHRFTTSCAD
jgi:hypothetical protein